MLDVVHYPHRTLLSVAEVVTTFDEELRELVDHMVETMYASDGVGLAAPQVNVSRRVIVFDPSGGEESGLLAVMINPEVTWRSDLVNTGPEACLSVPGVTLQVTRSSVVQIEYDDIMGSRQSATLDRAARVVQHEIDHLDGVTILDHVGPMARRLAMKDLGRKT